MATFYIDPSLTSNGDGSLGTPFNTWVGVTLTANNIYLQKRGTQYTGATVRPQSQASAAATPLTIGAYFNADGSDDPTQPKPVIDHAGGTNGIGAVFIDTCSNVIVKDIIGQNSYGSLGGGVTVRRSQNVLIQRCVGRNSEHGFVIQQDQTDSTSTTTDITVDSCEGYTTISSGITLRWGAVSSSILKRIKITNSLWYDNGSGKYIGAGATSVPCGGITSYTQNKASIGTAGFISYDIVCDNNVVRDNFGYGINIEGFANERWVSTCNKNTVTRNGKSLDVDTHSLWVGNSEGMLIAENLVYKNYGRLGAASGSGVGIFIDYNGSSVSGGNGCKVFRNIVKDQWQDFTTAPELAASAGILVLYNNNTLVESNLVVNCRNGLSIGNGGATDVTTVRNNTFINCTNSGINVLPQGTNAVLTNNVVRTTALGLFVNTASTAGYSETYNSVTNATVAKANGTQAAQTPTTLDPSDLTNDPKLDANYRPKSDSPLRTGGTNLGFIRDLDAVLYKKQIGCYGGFGIATERGVR